MSSLEKYVESKIPEEYRKYLMYNANNRRVVVVGVFDHHFEEYCKLNKMTPPEREKSEQKKRPKTYNCKRPILWQTSVKAGFGKEDLLILTVMPGNKKP